MHQPFPGGSSPSDPFRNHPPVVSWVWRFGATPGLPVETCAHAGAIPPIRASQACSSLRPQGPAAKVALIWICHDTIGSIAKPALSISCRVGEKTGTVTANGARLCPRRTSRSGGISQTASKMLPAPVFTTRCGWGFCPQPRSMPVRAPKTTENVMASSSEARTRSKPPPIAGLISA